MTRRIGEVGGCLLAWTGLFLLWVVAVLISVRWDVEPGVIYLGALALTALALAKRFD